MANRVKLTPEEIRARRNEASRRWYAAHKAKGAVNKAGKKAVKNADFPAAKKAAPVKKADGALIMKRVDKLVKKNIKAVGQVKGLMKEAAEILGDTYKIGDEKLIASVQKALGKSLCIQVDAQTLEPEGKAKKVVSFAVGSKLFRVPKRKGTPDGADQAGEPAAEREKTAEQGPGVSDVQPREIPVDPSKLEGVESGGAAEADIDSLTGGETGDEDEDDRDAEEEEEEDDVDEDELSDEEREERRRRRAEKDAEDFQEDYLSGRGDMMRELNAQGFGEED